MATKKKIIPLVLHKLNHILQLTWNGAQSFCVQPPRTAYRLSEELHLNGFHKCLKNKWSWLTLDYYS